MHSYIEVEVSKPITFSIVMASTLAPYKDAASGRTFKIFRAVESVILQSFTGWELLICADGCKKTFDIISESYRSTPGIYCSHLYKSPQWSGGPRNHGIDNATGQYIIYLDIDDYYGPSHLKTVSDNLQELNYPAWVWYNDRWPKMENKKLFYSQWVEHPCDINRRFKHGTSNICHRRDLNEYWQQGGYEHDRHFIDQLKRYPGHRIPTPDYRVCHVPRLFDI
jgi:glycosyltransferase involved in cell wall biosynthesis